MKLNNLALVICINLLFSLSSFAQEPPEHYQQHCVDCHARMTGGDGSVLYKRTEGLVNDMSSLNARVQYCAQQTNNKWTENEVHEIVQFLNKNYYNYPVLK